MLQQPKGPPKPEWLQRLEWLEIQPDLLDSAREVLPFVEGLLPLFERTSMIEAYEEVNRVVQRLKGAIAKASPQAKKVYP